MMKKIISFVIFLTFSIPVFASQMYVIGEVFSSPT